MRIVLLGAAAAAAALAGCAQAGGGRLMKPRPGDQDARMTTTGAVCPEGMTAEGDHCVDSGGAFGAAKKRR